MRKKATVVEKARRVVVDPNRSTVDGTSYDDLRGLSPQLRKALIARNLVYCTELFANGDKYCGHVIALSYEQADQIVFGRGLDEKVVGRLVDQV